MTPSAIMEVYRRYAAAGEALNLLQSPQLDDWYHPVNREYAEAWRGLRRCDDIPASASVADPEASLILLQAAARYFGWTALHAQTSE